ncbi:DNA adenine methylase [Vibrio owensii]|uniref:DNA adenine methylase n=1 Tax=Vibrio harveyi group TaxID=717610 RepID=UPI003CC583CB
MNNNTNNGSLDPIIKWAGGKRWLKNVIKEFYLASGKTTLCEPFAGGIAASLHIQPKHAVINDLNPHVINLYRQIAAGMQLNESLQNTSDDYYKNRKRFNELAMQGIHNTPETAQLFYYLNKSCFNGLCRFNKKGGFNVPFGNYDSVSLIRDFSQYMELFKGWDFIHGSYKDLDVGKDTFAIIDSPYDEVFSSYTVEGFNKNDQTETIEWADDLGIPMLMTNNPTDFIMDLIIRHGFDYKILSSRRTIAANGDKRHKALEVIAWKGMEAPESFVKGEMKLA